MEPQEVVDLWNSICHPPFPRAKTLNATRRLQIGYAAKEINGEWEEFFNIIATKKGNWLMGKYWMSFDWVIDPDNRVKVYEEGYLTPRGSDDQRPSCVPR